MSNGENNGANTMLVGGLGILFVGLKLGHIINWSWWFVTMPFWIGTVIVLLVIVVLAIIEARDKRAREKKWGKR